MADFRLHCFVQSGNAYKAALMLELAGCDWEPVFVAFLDGETREEAWREKVNDMGEAPVLEHGDVRLSQSGVILDYLAETTGRFGPRDDAERREILRWILFDNHKFTGQFATLRFLYGILKTGETPVTEFFRQRVRAAYGIVDKHLETRTFMVGERLTIADLSLAGYVFYEEETGIDRAREFPHIEAWVERLRALEGWKSPAELMPSHA